MADETTRIITEFVVTGTDQAIERTKEFDKQVEQLKIQLKTISAETGKPIKEVAEGIKRAFSDSVLKPAKANIDSLKNSLVDLKTRLQEIRATPVSPTFTTEDKTAAIQAQISQINTVNASLRSAQSQYKQLQAVGVQTNKALSVATQQVVQQQNQLQNSTKQTANSFSTLGKAIQYALGLSIFQVISTAIGWLKNAAQAAYEFAKSMYSIEVAVRALRRSGIEITTEAVYKNLDRLQKKFGTFSKVELVEGAAAFLNLNRDMGFTQEQLFELQDAIATLAIVNGRSMDDVQKTVALALSSGYTEGLQRLGVSINRVTIANKALQLGYAGNYMALTEVQRAEATRILVLEKTAKYQNDLTEYQKSYVGQIDKSKASIKDLTAAIGNNLIPVMRIWYDLLAKLTQGFAMLSGVITYNIAQFEALSEIFSTENPKTLAQIKDIIHEMKLMGDALMEGFAGDWTNFNKNFTFTSTVDIGPSQESINQQQQREEIVNQINQEIIDAQTQFEQDSIDLDEDYQNDLDKIDREGEDRRLEQQRDYYARLDKMERDHLADESEAQIKYNQDVSNALIELDRADAEQRQKARDRELKAEEDYQEKLLKLREGFILDLEDALRVRDARQVLQLIRKYNLQKTQADREYEQQKQDNERQNREELEALAYHRSEKLRLLREEFEARNAERDRQFLREQIEEDIRHERDMDELRISLENQRREREIQHGLDEAQLQEDFVNHINNLVANLAVEKNLTADMLKAIGAEYTAVYGENGVVDAAITYAIQRIQDLNNALASIGTTNTPSSYSGGGGGGKPYQSKASGGTVYAGSPQLVQFGEVPEVATFTPVNQLNSNKMGSGVSGGKSGKTTIEVLLSPGLEARVVDNALSQVADVMVKVQRAR